MQEAQEQCPSDDKILKKDKKRKKRPVKEQTQTKQTEVRKWVLKCILFLIVSTVLVFVFFSFPPCKMSFTP